MSVDLSWRWQATRRYGTSNRGRPPHHGLNGRKKKKRTYSTTQKRTREAQKNEKRPTGAGTGRAGRRHQQGGGGTSAMRCPVRGCRQRHCRHHARGRHRVDVSWGAMQLAGEAGGSLWRQRRLPRRGLSALPAAASCRASTTRARGRRACAVERTFFVRRLHGHYSVHTTGSPN